MTVTQLDWGCGREAGVLSGRGEGARAPPGGGTNVLCCCLVIFLLVLGEWEDTKAKLARLAAPPNEILFFNVFPTPIPHHPPNNPTLAPPQPLALLPRYQPRAGASVSPHSQVLGTRVWGGAASGLQKRRLRRYAPRRRSQACERWCVTSQIQECN